MRILIFIFWLFPCHLFAQIPAGKWSVGVNLSLDNNYRILTLKESSLQTKSVKESRDNEEIPLFGISSGATILYHITPKFSLSIGAQYAQKGYQTTKYQTLVINASTGSSIIANASYIINYTYTDIPFIIRYQFGKRKIKFILGAGIAANFLNKCEEELKIYYSTYTDTYFINHKSAFRKYNYSALFHFGTNHQLSNRINLYVEPTIRFQLQENINQPITERLYNIGLNLSLFYRL